VAFAEAGHFVAVRDPLVLGFEGAFAATSRATFLMFAMYSGKVNGCGVSVALRIESSVPRLYFWMTKCIHSSAVTVPLPEEFISRNCVMLYIPFGSCPDRSVLARKYIRSKSARLSFPSLSPSASQMSAATSFAAL